MAAVVNALISPFNSALCDAIVSADGTTVYEAQFSTLYLSNKAAIIATEFSSDYATYHTAN